VVVVVDEWMCWWMVGALSSRQHPLSCQLDVALARVLRLLPLLVGCEGCVYVVEGGGTVVVLVVLVLVVRFQWSPRHPHHHPTHSLSGLLAPYMFAVSAAIHQSTGGRLC
jgi:hypothetical protein